MTNKTPNAPYRGAGRPEAVFAIDRIVDLLARELGMDPAELRRRNYLAAADLPYESTCRIATAIRSSTTAATSGPALEAALGAVGYEALRREQAGSARGASTAASGSRATSRARPSARTRARRSGWTPRPRGGRHGRGSQGQGQETSFAQMAADVLGIPIEWVTVMGGDTAAIPFGVGTFASRSAVNAGSSIHVASGRVKDKLVAAAAALLEAAPDDVEIADGMASVRGTPASAVPLGRVIQASMPTFARAGVSVADFEATVYHHQPTVTYTSAIHVACVEVDAGTGAVHLLRYLVAHDCGRSSIR